MTFDTERAFRLIVDVAEEQRYYVEEEHKTSYEVYSHKYHGVAFKIFKNSSGYIQCNAWDEAKDDYGRALYSLRSQSDVVIFCGILINSELIRAKRMEEQ